MPEFTDPHEHPLAPSAPRGGRRPPRNATEVPVELIRNAIFQGRLVPGQRLKEEELARELGISRTPVREALHVLQAEGMIVSTPNRGAMVRTYSHDELLDLYELRALLEGFAAGRAARCIGDDDLTELARSCDRFATLREADDRLGLSRENLHFHNLIGEAADTTRLAELIRTAREIPLVYQAFNWFSKEEAAESERSHRQIHTALANHDAERAELAMKHHVLEGRDFLIAHIRESQLSPGTP